MLNLTTLIPVPGLRTFIVLALILAGAPAQAQRSDALIFPDFDKACLSLWLAADSNDEESCRQMARKVTSEWESVRDALNEITVEHIDMQDFIKRVHSYVLSIPICAEASNFSCLKSISYHLLYEFRSLRQCLYRTEYPLDLLWEGIDDYLEIKNTINDRMFNLKEWFEFEDDINAFICKWEYYDLQHIKEINHYFPGVKKAEHTALKDKVNGCIYTLLKSLESGYQSDFVLPCDELGFALDDLLRLYARSKGNMLM